MYIIIIIYVKGRSVQDTNLKLRLQILCDQMGLEGIILLCFLC